MSQVHIGTAGWAIPREHAAAFPREGSGLARYASVLNAAEINSTFYRRHQAATFERWRATVPRDFRFSVKLPRAITHEAELASPRALLTEFFGDVSALGDRLGPILVQLPPSLAFDARRAGAFFRAFRALHGGPVACEPRHASWYTERVDALFVSHAVARVVADPPRPAAASERGGASNLLYLRLHGSPRPYYSAYGPERLAALAGRIGEARTAGATVWCIFDNTASGAAARDALTMREQLRV
jgi:uncharacterized protein YecE (DUF72 family)